MPAVISEILIELRNHTVLWAIIVIAAMAFTAIVLYVFWDLVGRGISLVARALNIGQPGQRR